MWRYLATISIWNRSISFWKLCVGSVEIRPHRTGGAIWTWVGSARLDTGKYSYDNCSALFRLVSRRADAFFHANGDMDLDGQRRVLDCMIDQGVDGICILANYSEQFLLSRRRADTQLTEVCLEHVGDRVPVMVTCSHFSTRIAAGRAAHASSHGSGKLLMMMPPYHGAGAIKVDESAIYEHFTRVADAGGIPVMIQDAPLSSVDLSVDLLVRIARARPPVRYFQIEECPAHAGQAAQAHRSRR